ncbi:MAG: DUF5666 domain-containing protein [Acidobacteriaceae bacterium]
MKAYVRIAAPLLVAAVFCLSQGHAQPLAQDQQGGGGMAELQAHSIRGDVTAVSGNDLTVKTEEGQVYTVATGPNTRFRKQRDQIQITGIHPGDMIVAVGDKDPKARTLGAVFVMVIDKEQYQKMRADFGKTWTAGVVESINGTNIVIKRPDKTTQTIAVDENTSFRKRREDITLPDIKPGDNLTARGALHDGAFLATLVSVGRRGGFAGQRGSGTHGSDTPGSTN